MIAMKHSQRDFHYGPWWSGENWWKEIDYNPQIPPATSMVLPVSINALDLWIRVLITACVGSFNVTSKDTKSWNPIFTGTISGRGLLLIMGLHSPCPQANLNEGRVLTKTTRSSGSQTSLLYVLCAVSCQWLLGEVHFVMESKLLFSHKTPPR